MKRCFLNIYITPKWADTKAA